MELTRLMQKEHTMYTMYTYGYRNHLGSCFAEGPLEPPLARQCMEI